MFNLSKFTMNLSSVHLSEAQISILDKGLTFIPSTRYIPYSRILECKNRNLRNIKVRDYFYGRSRKYDPTAFCNMFKFRSTWEPPIGRLAPEAVQAIIKISSYTASLIKNRLVKTRVEGQGPLIRLPQMRPNNITKSEARAITQLKSNDSVVIKPADKGGAVVVMDRDLYQQEGLRQLLNPHYYREIDNTIAAETVSEINEIIDNLQDIKFITEEQHDYLRTLVPQKPRSFYLLYLKFTKIELSGRIRGCQRAAR